MGRPMSRMTVASAGEGRLRREADTSVWERNLPRARGPVDVTRADGENLSVVDTVVVGDTLPELDIAPQQPQVHRPAVAGYAVVLVELGPGRMVKTNQRFLLTLRASTPG